MDTRIPDTARKGRGAVSNDRSTRFTALQRERTDDGWAGARSANGACPDAADAPADDFGPDGDALEGPAPRTVIGTDRSKSALAWNRSPDVPFDRSLNPYQGVRARLRRLLRPADPRLPRPVARPGFRDPDLRQAGRARTAAGKSSPSPATGRRRSRWAPTPTPTSRPSASTGSPARCWRCWRRRAIRCAS
ncbi:MAG: hypothetical protein U5L06_15285 [Rhodovibrio sp.]|nr:hypothetical protein [Rhodovibrio sp.]